MRRACAVWQFYDDQADSFPKISRPGADGKTLSCEDRMALAKPMSGGDDHKIGLLPEKGRDHVFNVKVQEHWPREWFFVAADCNAEEVRLSKFKISSPASIACAEIHHQPSVVGYNVPLILLIIINVALLAMAVVLFRRMRGGVGGDSLLTPDQVAGYNEL